MKKKDYLAVVLTLVALGAAIFECWWLYAVTASIALFTIMFICDK